MDNDFLAKRLLEVKKRLVSQMTLVREQRAGLAGAQRLGLKHTVTAMRNALVRQESAYKVSRAEYDELAQQLGVAPFEEPETGGAAQMDAFAGPSV